MSSVFTANERSMLDSVICSRKITSSSSRTNTQGKTFTGAERAPPEGIAAAVELRCRWLGLLRLRRLTSDPRSFRRASCRTAFSEQVLDVGGLSGAQCAASSSSLEARYPLAMATHFSHLARLSLMDRASIVFFQNVDLPKTTWQKHRPQFGPLTQRATAAAAYLELNKYLAGVG
jgi:hypothetical protein